MGEARAQTQRQAVRSLHSQLERSLVGRERMGLVLVARKQALKPLMEQRSVRVVFERGQVAV